MFFPTTEPQLVERLLQEAFDPYRIGRSCDCFRKNDKVDFVVRITALLDTKPVAGSDMFATATAASSASPPLEESGERLNDDTEVDATGRQAP